MLVYHARISVPENKRNEPGEKLIAYLFEHNHVSPADMVNLCVSVTTTRDIGRQMLRHWSIKPQEYSQRYANPLKDFGEPVYREARLQDKKNRQQSIEVDDNFLKSCWKEAQTEVWDIAVNKYEAAIKNGIAKEVARVVLPEGMTPTRMDFNGTIRSWLHFCDLRRKSEGAQHEIELIAADVWKLIEEHAPLTAKAWNAIRERKLWEKKMVRLADYFLDHMNEGTMPTVEEAFATKEAIWKNG
jgi:thymidylate synthase (FAD)